MRRRWNHTGAKEDEDDQILTFECRSMGFIDLVDETHASRPWMGARSRWQVAGRNYTQAIHTNTHAAIQILSCRVFDASRVSTSSLFAVSYCVLLVKNIDDWTDADAHTSFVLRVLARQRTILFFLTCMCTFIEIRDRLHIATSEMWRLSRRRVSATVASMPHVSKCC